MAPDPVREVAVDVQLLQLQPGRVERPRGSLAEDGAGQPVALHGLVLDLQFTGSILDSVEPYSKTEFNINF